MFPFSVQNPRYGFADEPARVPVPCGKCPDCLKRRVNEWSFRLQREERLHDHAHFVTLTYDTPPITANGFMTLRKTDCQLFFKRLRKTLKNDGFNYRIAYYLCGEYGTKRARPHYHIILFGLHDTRYIERCWTNFEGFDTNTGERVISVGGLADIGSVTGASIGYTLKYMHKGKVVPQHPRDDRLSEFALMSKRLGANYLTKEVIKYHREDGSRTYLTNPDGFTVSMPRYYREKIWSDSERRINGKKLAALHEKKEQKRQQKYIQKFGTLEGYDKAKFEAKKAAIANFKRRANEKRGDV